MIKRWRRAVLRLLLVDVGPGSTDDQKGLVHWR
jgi:hypothetical protein